LVYAGFYQYSLAFRKPPATQLAGHFGVPLFVLFIALVFLTWAEEQREKGSNAAASSDLKILLPGDKDFKNPM